MINDDFTSFGLETASLPSTRHLVIVSKITISEGGTEKKSYIINSVKLDIRKE